MDNNLLPILQTTYSTDHRDGISHCPKCASTVFYHVETLECGENLCTCATCGTHAAILLSGSDPEYDSAFLHSEANHFLRNLTHHRFGFNYDFPAMETDIQFHRDVRRAASRLHLNKADRSVFIEHMTRLWEQEND
jgi:hypothetical protein